MSDHSEEPGEFCVFCTILAGELPASFAYQDDNVVSIMDINPVTPGHLLVLPRRHLPDLADVDGATAAHMMKVAQRLAAALRAGTDGVEGMNLFYSDGPIAGQEVAHAHLHVIPRYRDDGFRLKIDYGTPPSRDDLEATAARVAAALDPE